MGTLTGSIWWIKVKEHVMGKDGNRQVIEVISVVHNKEYDMV